MHPVASTFVVSLMALTLAAQPSAAAPAVAQPVTQSGLILPPRPTPVMALPAAEPGMLCRQAIRTAERAAGLPTQLMAAIGRIESGRSDARGVIHPWPWTINAEGTGHVYASKADAIAGVRALQAQGVRSIDIGCMQVNLMYHPQAFANLDEAFDPLANAHYAARFLNTLYAQTGTWARATAWYHSAVPEQGDPYQRKVAAVLQEEMGKLGITPDGPPPAAAGNMFSTNVWTNNVWNAGPGPARTAANQAGPHLPPAPTMLTQGGGTMLSNHAEAARLLPAPPGTAGRGLDAYRAAPIPVASLTLNRARL